MNYKINLLSVAVTASLLTACGKGSSSSPADSLVNPVNDQAITVVVTPETVETVVVETSGIAPVVVETTVIAPVVVETAAIAPVAVETAAIAPVVVETAAIAPVVDAPVVVETAVTDPASYKLTQAELLTLGKTFIDDLNTQVGGLKTDLDMSANQNYIRTGLDVFSKAISEYDLSMKMMRNVIDHGFETHRITSYEYIIGSPLSYAPNYVLGQLYYGYDGKQYVFSMNDAGQIVLTGYMPPGHSHTVRNLELIADGEDILISSMSADPDSDMTIEVTKAGLAVTNSDDSEEIGIVLNIENMRVVADDGTTSTARIEAEMTSERNAAPDSEGTLNYFWDNWDQISAADNRLPSIYIPIQNSFAGIVGYSPLMQNHGLHHLRGYNLNLSTLHIYDLYTELASGKSLSVDSIRYEDVDADMYVGSGASARDFVRYAYLDENGDVVDDSQIESSNVLELNGEFGSTTYRYTPSHEGISATVSCDTQVANFYQGAPQIRITALTRDTAFFYSALKRKNIVSPPIVECGEPLIVGQSSLVDFISAKAGAIATNDYEVRDFSPAIITDSAQGVLYSYGGYGMTQQDDFNYPITYTMAARGAHGLAGGEIVPFSMNLNHPGASVYEVQAEIGIAPEALIVDFSTLKKDVVMASSASFIPADTAFSAREVGIAFSYSALFTDPDLDAETGDKVYGSLTVDGTEIAVLKEPGNIQKRFLEAGQSSYVLEFVDGTYPQSGGFYATLEDVRIECPVGDDAATEPCSADQPRSVDVHGLINTLFESMLMTAPFPQAAPLEAP